MTRDRLAPRLGVIPGRGGDRRARRSRDVLILFAIPSLILVVVFFIVPFLLNSVFAFMQWTGFSDRMSFNGLKNFEILAQLGVLGHATGVTLVYAVVAMVVQNLVSLSLALLLQKTSAATSVFRSLFFIPVLIAPVAAGYVWAANLAPHGPINQFISLFVPGFDFAWLGHDWSALVVVASVDAWKWSGLVTLVYIAGLNAIPQSMLDAASIDGAGRWRRFWSIKFPLVAPATTFNIVVTLVGALSAFDIVMATTKGGPGNATTVLNVAVYQQFSVGFFGSASALSFVVTVLVLVTAVPLITWLRTREVEL